MRSSDGQYYSKLDHLRALAALMVFSWHFGHAAGLPFDAAPVWPFALFEEGHTGVALFMTLSGYLFAKIIGDRSINPVRFLLNRAIRLGPLLIAVLLTCLALGRTTVENVVLGFALPTWPNGGWSIAAELHFYAILPVVLFFARKRPWMILVGIAAMLLLRAAYFEWSGSVYRVAYFTIGGRIDQFLIGVAAWYGVRMWTRARAFAALGVFVAFTVYFQIFNAAGGIYGMPSDPSTSPIWIVHPTLEALGYAALILLYDRSAVRLPGPLDAALAKVGELSYSIYLLHFFIFREAAAVAARVFRMDAFWVSLPVTVVAFVLFLPVCELSYRLIEKPFLRLRTRYTRPAAAPSPGPAAEPRAALD